MEREKDLSELESRFVSLLECLQFQNILTAICYHSLNFRNIFFSFECFESFFGQHDKVCVFLLWSFTFAQ